MDFDHDDRPKLRMEERLHRLMMRLDSDDDDTTCPSPSQEDSLLRRHNGHKKGNEPDDEEEEEEAGSEDANEDDDGGDDGVIMERRRQDDDDDNEHQEINKEQEYYDKLALLKTKLEELAAGNHADYNRQLSKLDKDLEHRNRLNDAFRDQALERIQRDSANENLRAAREFEEKTIELRESLVKDFEAKKRQLKQDRFAMRLTSSSASDMTTTMTAEEVVKPMMTTRKLGRPRRRPNEPVVVPPIPGNNRRKNPQSQIKLLLDKQEIDEDLKKCLIAMRNFKNSASGNNDSSDQAPINTALQKGKKMVIKRKRHEAAR